MDLAKRIGVNEMTIVNWEKGRTKATKKNMEKRKALMGFEPSSKIPKSVCKVQIPAPPRITLNYFNSLQIPTPKEYRQQTATEIHPVAFPIYLNGLKQFLII